MEYEIYNTDELTHHGIKGMRWGVRRFQNKDGSLTPAGEKRRARLENKLEKLGGPSKKTSDDSDDSSRKKTASNMSDEDLARAITRARMEDEYRRLRPEPVPPEKHPFMKQIANDVIKPAAINAGKNLAQNLMNQAVENLTKGKVDPNSLSALKDTFEKLDYKQKIDKIVNPDKYLNEDDKTKRQDRLFKAEDREAKKEGYADAADKAVKQREAAEAARKAKADMDAADANKATSESYYNSVYQKTKGSIANDDYAPAEKSYVNSRTGESIVTNSAISSGQNYVNNNPILALPAPKNVSQSTASTVDAYLASIGIEKVQ